MADADLDVLIRRIAKEQNKGLIAAARSRRDRYISLAAKAKDKETRERLRKNRKDTMLHGTAAAKRLQISAENTADSYTRSMRNAAEDRPAQKTANNTSTQHA